MATFILHFDHFIDICVPYAAYLPTY